MRNTRSLLCRRASRTFAIWLSVALVVSSAATASVAATKTTKTSKTTRATNSKTTKTTTAKPVVPARSAQKAVGSGSSDDAGNDTASLPTPTVKPTTTTAPPPRSSGTPIKGWEHITSDEWPAIGDSVIAVSIGRTLEVLRAPGDRTGALRLEQGRSMYGAIRLLGLGTRGGWVRVGVPIRPNGTVGWVKAGDVRLQRNFAHIQIELASNTMRVYDGDRISIETKVAAGTGGTPTPTGLFFVKELVPQPNPNGALGPFAFGLSGFSTVLHSFANGEGTIGIHGTNAPNRIGGDVSHGCVRITNANVLAMTKIVPLGAPVEIVQSWADLSSKRRASDWVEQVGIGTALASPQSSTTTSTTEGTSTTAPTTTVPSSGIELATIPIAGTS